MKKILIEELAPQVAALTEMKKGGDMYMSGIMMQAELVNGNGRKYPLDEIKRAVEGAQDRIKKGFTILGELNHPDVLTIDPKNVSHIITDIRMDGNNAVGKMKLVNTPNGQIVRAIIEGGGRLGVSSRGTGNVNEAAVVSDFNFVTVDIVSQPSAPDAYPNVVYESLQSKKITTLAEAAVHDPRAQKYLVKEALSLIEAITKGTKK